MRQSPNKGPALPAWRRGVFLVLTLGLCGLGTAYAQDGIDCVYPAPKDTGALFAAIKQTVKAAGAPEPFTIGLSFDKNRAQVEVERPTGSFIYRWQVGTKCKKPYRMLTTVSPDAPGWAKTLQGTLWEKMPLEPVPTSRARRKHDPERERLPSILHRRKVSTPIASIIMVPTWISWMLLLLAMGCWYRREARREARPKEPINLWLLAGIAMGVISLIWLAGLRVFGPDEIAYLRLPDDDAANAYSFRYYLADAGLPSRAHRLLLLPIASSGALVILDALHIALYAGTSIILYRIGLILSLPKALALGVTLYWAWDHFVLFYFVEHRSYALFIFFSTLGQLKLIQFVKTGNRRDAFWMVGTIGIASMDNPLCLLPLGALLVAAVVVRQWRQRLNIGRLVLSCLFLGLAVLPLVLSASMTGHGDYGTPRDWFLRTWIYVIPILFFVPKDPHLAILRPTAIGLYCLIILPMILGLLPWVADKTELFAVPLLLSVSIAAIHGHLKVQKWPTWAAPAVFLGFSLMQWPFEDPMHVVADKKAVQRVHTFLESKTGPNALPVYWGRSAEQIEFLTSVVEVDPFKTVSLSALEFPKHYRNSHEEEPAGDRCRRGKRFRQIVRVYTPDRVPCKTCVLEMENTDSWSVVRCP